MAFVSRAGEKLDFGLKQFGSIKAGAVCADFGSNTGGFVDCLLQAGAAKVYAVETGYGVLDWQLRKDPRVVAMERTNAMHVQLPEPVDFISIDTSWTKLAKIVPNALANLKPGGRMIALVKPHYEAGPHQLRAGKLDDMALPAVLKSVEAELAALGVSVIHQAESPIQGGKAKNREFLFELKGGAK